MGLGNGVSVSDGEQLSDDQGGHTRVERQRSSDVERSAELLRTIADVLDIRTVFHRVSEIASKTLPHDALAMVFVDRGRHYVHQAKWPADFPDPPSVTLKTPLPDEYIIADVGTGQLPRVRTRGRVPVRSLQPGIARCWP